MNSEGPSLVIIESLSTNRKYLEKWMTSSDKCSSSTYIALAPVQMLGVEGFEKSLLLGTHILMQEKENKQTVLFWRMRGL